MNTVIALKDVVNLKLNGEKSFNAPAGAIITPSARDFLRGLGVTINFTGCAGAPAKAGASAPAAAGEQQWKPEHLKLFNSPEALKVKEHIVSVSHRLWQREYCDGNGGNVSVRVGPNEVLCTPTLVSKGIMRVEDICMVDLDGNQLAGTQKRTSEIFLHLEIMKANPKARSCVHCHPPHATAFALTTAEVPQCINPELEVMVGTVAKAHYETPGTKKFAETILPYCQNHNVILLQNHGVISWNENLERAYWFMEIVDAYCRTLIIGAQLGAPFTYIPNNKIGDLLKIKQGLGLPDSRVSGKLKEADYCACEFRPGVTVSSVQAAGEGTAAPSKQELDAIVQAVTEGVMKALAGK